MDPSSLAIFYEDCRRSVDHQHERLRHLRDRANVLLVGSAGLAIIAGPGNAGPLVLLSAVLALAVAVCCVAVIWPIRYSDFQMQLITEPSQWLNDDAQAQANTLAEVSSERLASTRSIVATRARWLQSASLLFVAEVVFMGLAVIGSTL